MYAVKVLDCEGSGSVSNVLAGLDHAITEVRSPALHRLPRPAHVHYECACVCGVCGGVGEQIVGKSPRRPTVINLSLGAPASAGSSIVSFAESAVDSNIVVVAAGGNDAVLACSLAPALSPKVISVASSSTGDTFSTAFSNHGSCVDVIAPGASIVSSSRVSDSTHELRSGTSMASPYVAGLAAQYLSAHPTATVQQVRDAIACAAVPGALRAVPADTPNLLALSMSRYLDTGVCHSQQCVLDSDCEHGVCASGACKCDCGWAGFNCARPVAMTYLGDRSGFIDGDTSSGGDDWWGDETNDAAFSITLPANARLQLALCSAQTTLAAKVVVLSDCPSQLYDDAALATSSNPTVVDCSLSDASTGAPIDLDNLAAGSYHIIVTSTAGSAGVTAGAFRLAYHVTDPGASACLVSTWSEWSSCSPSCGVGTQTRSRSTATPGVSCPALSEQRSCSQAACTCEVSEWSAWSACDASCGDGTQTRSRTQVSGHASACPALSESQACSAGVACSCVVSTWGAWGACSASCGDGTRARSRTVEDAGVNNDCPALMDTEACNAGSCECVVSEWGAWGGCSAACGYGTRTRSRSHTDGPMGSCPELVESEECFQQACASGCVVGEWGSWSGCTAVCGGGTRCVWCCVARIVCGSQTVVVGVAWAQVPHPRHHDDGEQPRQRLPRAARRGDVQHVGVPELHGFVLERLGVLRRCLRGRRANADALHHRRRHERHALPGPHAVAGVHAGHVWCVVVLCWARPVRRAGLTVVHFRLCACVRSSGGGGAAVGG